MTDCKSLPESLSLVCPVIPSQDHLPEGGFGNLVALPLQGKARKNGNSVFVDETFTSFEDQWAYLLNVRKVSGSFVDEVLALHGLSSELGELSTTSESKPWEAPVPQKITNEDFPKELVCVKSDMLYVPLAGLSGKALNHIKRIASFKNPEFYAKQGMRLSTYNIPRIISCADVSEEYVALPRGCEDVIVELFMNNHACYRMTDETNPGKCISVKFKGELGEEQEEAIVSLMVRNFVWRSSWILIMLRKIPLISVGARLHFLLLVRSIQMGIDFMQWLMLH